MNEIRAVVIESGRPAVIDTIATDNVAERVGASEELKAMKLIVVKTFDGSLDSNWSLTDNRASMLAYGYPSEELRAGTYAVVGLDSNKDLDDIPLILAGMLTGTITTIADQMKGF